MSKTTFTYIDLKNGRIGVIPPGSHLRDNPKYHNTIAEAMTYVLDCNVGKKMDIRFDDSCVNGKGAHASFNPNDFRRECMERQKSHKPTRERATA